MRHLRRSRIRREERQASAAERAAHRAVHGDAAQLESLIEGGHGEGREAARLRAKLAKEGQ